MPQPAHITIRNARSPRTHTHGFTLIELLVVVSIIVLLISLLLPALRKARDATRLTMCLANVRQIGIGFIVWSNDNKGLWPAFYREYESLDHSASPNYHQYRSIENGLLEFLLRGYVGNADRKTEWEFNRKVAGGVFVCPSSPVRVIESTRGGTVYGRTDGQIHGGTTNNYTGLYYHWLTQWAKAPTNTGRGPAYRAEWFPKQPQAPMQFCSMNRSQPLALFDGVITQSWHGKLYDYDAPPRPTVYADGHAHVITKYGYTYGTSQSLIRGNDTSGIHEWGTWTFTNGSPYAVSDY